jgi:hypothetical protein
MILKCYCDFGYFIRDIRTIPETEKNKKKLMTGHKHKFPAERIFILPLEVTFLDVR